MFIENKDIMKGSGIKVAGTGAQFLVDKLQECRQREINELYSSLGTATVNTDKRERIQGAEVNTSIEYAYDSIMINCDTFNYDAKYGGINIRMKPNTGIIKIWNGVNKDEKDYNENKNDNNEDKSDNFEEKGN